MTRSLKMGCAHPSFAGRSFAQTDIYRTLIDVSGAYEGHLASDTISVGGLSVPNQNLGALLHSRFLLFFPNLSLIAAIVPNAGLSANDPFVGIVGLGFTAMSKIGKTSFLENLIKRNSLRNNMFSIYHTREGKMKGSELVLGGVDSSKYEGGFLRVPLVQDGDVSCRSLPLLLFLPPTDLFPCSG